MITGNVKMALDAIRTAKWRSLLTMLGIIVGVASVVTIVSLGEGAKQEIVGQINHLGPDLLTIRPGKTITRGNGGDVSGVNLLATFGGGATMPENDLAVVQKAPGVGVAVPLSLVTGTVSANGREYDQGFVVGTTEGMPEILNQKIEYGGFFGQGEDERNVAVIGKRVAEQLFGENGPIGRSMDVRGHTFVVRGVFQEFADTPLIPNNNYNYAIFIPFKTAKAISGNQTQIQQILAKPQDPQAVPQTMESISGALKGAHGGQEDFTILQQSDNLAIASRVLNLLTGLISAVAAISLIVGGIGIMNIMLVSVSERTHEIGVRKAVGATNRQILGQFLVEAAMISFVGGLIGVGISLLANFGLRILTELHPVITLPIMVVAVTVAVGVGVFFGMTPALKAARKDPIEALRQI
jgi:ABC-type antimicrobial peptide transport system permease subunit